jgi:ABC-2 type transport system permease protein
MIRRLWDAYWVEVMKALRQRATLLGPGLVVAVVLVMPRVHPLARDGQGDYAFIGYATTSVLNLLGLFLLLVFCAPQIAGEIQTGAIRTVLVRPILRRDFYLAKLAAGLTYAVALMLAVAACAWGVAWRAGDLTGVTAGGQLLYSNAEMAGMYAAGMLGAVVPLGAAVAFALLISAMARGAGTAVGAAIAIWLAVDLVKYPLGVSPWVFSTYVETPWRVFMDRAEGVPAAWWPTAGAGLAVCAVSFLLLAGAGLAVFGKRNLRL